MTSVPNLLQQLNGNRRCSIDVNKKFSVTKTNFPIEFKLDGIIKVIAQNQLSFRTRTGTSIFPFATKA